MPLHVLNLAVFLDVVLSLGLGEVVICTQAMKKFFSGDFVFLRY